PLVWVEPSTPVRPNVLQHVSIFSQALHNKAGATSAGIHWSRVTRRPWQLEIARRLADQGLFPDEIASIVDGDAECHLGCNAVHWYEIGHQIGGRGFRHSHAAFEFSS